MHFLLEAQRAEKIEWICVKNDPKTSNGCRQHQRPGNYHATFDIEIKFLISGHS